MEGAWRAVTNPVCRSWRRHGQLVLVRKQPSKTATQTAETKSDRCDRYGYHMPRTNLRDAYYNKLEEKRVAEKTAQ